MSIFKKKKQSCCDCGNCGGTSEISNARIKVLGSGCDKCSKLEENVKKALSSLGLDLEVGHVTDFAQISNYGVMTTPALVFDEKVVSYGKVLSIEEAIELLKDIK